MFIDILYRLIFFSALKSIYLSLVFFEVFFNEIFLNLKKK